MPQGPFHLCGAATPSHSDCLPYGFVDDVTSSERQNIGTDQAAHSGSGMAFPQAATAQPQIARRTTYSAETRQLTNVALRSDDDHQRTRRDRAPRRLDHPGRLVALRLRAAARKCLRPQARRDQPRHVGLQHRLDHPRLRAVLREAARPAAPPQDQAHDHLARRERRGAAALGAARPARPLRRQPRTPRAPRLGPVLAVPRPAHEAPPHHAPADQHPPVARHPPPGGAPEGARPQVRGDRRVRGARQDGGQGVGRAGCGCVDARVGCGGACRGEAERVSVRWAASERAWVCARV